jgi:hypothetical protein
LETIKEVYQQRRVPGTAPLLEELDAAYLVMSWFRRHPGELQLCRRPEFA